MTHCIKIELTYAQAVLEERKTFEVRLNDRGYNAGDEVVFEVVKNGYPVGKHPLEDHKFLITYVYSGNGLEKNYVVFGITKQRGVK